MNLGCKAGGIGRRAELNADAVPPVAVVVVLAEVACEARCVRDQAIGRLDSDARGNVPSVCGIWKDRVVPATRTLVMSR